MTDTLAPINSLLIPPGMCSQCHRLRIVRICDINSDGILISPHQRTTWIGPVMQAKSWSDSQAVLGQCGLHGVWDRWPDIRPDRIGQAVVHVLGDGRAVVSPWACRVERMSMREIVLHPEASDALLAAVRRRYPEVPVRRARASRAKRRRCVRMYSTGEVVVERYRDGLKHGWWEAWDPAGHRSIVHYRADRLHGRWEDIQPNGYRLVRRYRDGRRHGRWVEVWPVGRRIVSHYRDDLLHGRREEYTPDGRVVVSHYRAGVRIS